MLEGPPPQQAPQEWGRSWFLLMVRGVPVNKTMSRFREMGQLVRDRARGLDFLRGVEAEEVGLDPSIAFRSSPSGGAVLKRAMKQLAVSPSDRIIDIGCGKGDAIRTLLHFPFAKVDGLELSRELADTARSNFQRLKESRTSIYTGDARTFRGYSQYNFLYMYNPFPDSVMREVLTVIRSSPPEGHSRTLIYNNPTCHQAVVGEGGFSNWMDLPGRWDHVIRIYWG